ncbi:hypothetical protein [Microcoleus sp. FACHB-SPT15]|uniref:hypothetical protein n=1 Tax=Microcoleus sp. FACHB-SPT15 TaxID=2692830 RepID=UPI001A7E87A4|nr:hypothetical protein [Microcoleus sp. FACHB-SPT15]
MLRVKRLRFYKNALACVWSSNIWLSSVTNYRQHQTIRALILTGVIAFTEELPRSLFSISPTGGWQVVRCEIRLAIAKQETKVAISNHAAL